MESMLDRAAERVPLTGHEGMSGSRIERVCLDDGTRLVVKRPPTEDWQLRALHDSGREAYLWTSGLLSRLPSWVAHPVIAVERDDDGWLIIMRDVSSALFPAGSKISRSESQQVLWKIALMHDAFIGEPIPGLCSLADRYRLLSPAVAEKEAAANALPRRVQVGWPLFRELVPTDVGDAIFAILERPDSLAEELLLHPSTLIHGDLQPGNFGLTGDTLVVLDWGMLTAIAPPAVEFAYYLEMRNHWATIDASPEELIQDYRASAPHLIDERALGLALLGSLVMFGWGKGLACTYLPDEAARSAARDDLGWWVARAREALEVWSPV